MTPFSHGSRAAGHTESMKPAHLCAAIIRSGGTEVFMKKDKTGLRLDYDIKMGYGREHAQMPPSVACSGNYFIPLVAICTAATVCVTLCVARCVCFHMKYKKRR